MQRYAANNIRNATVPEHAYPGLWKKRHIKKGKRKVQGVPKPQAASHPRHKEEEKTDKTKQAQIEQTHEKHQD